MKHDLQHFLGFSKFLKSLTESFSYFNVLIRVRAKASVMSPQFNRLSLAQENLLRLKWCKDILVSGFLTVIFWQCSFFSFLFFSFFFDH